jgi:hypothetical protein
MCCHLICDLLKIEAPGAELAVQLSALQTYVSQIKRILSALIEDL